MTVSVYVGTAGGDLNLAVLAVQHERKPIIDKKEYPNNTGPAFNPSTNKIFIRKDLSTDSPALLPSTFNPCDLGLGPLFNKRIGEVSELTV